MNMDINSFIIILFYAKVVPNICVATIRSCLYQRKDSRNC